MSSARDAAEAVVAYDKDVARRPVARIAEELAGPSLDDRPELDRARGHLSSAGARGAASDLSTREWKIGFARRERMRAFGLELAKKL